MPKSNVSNSKASSVSYNFFYSSNDRIDFWEARAVFDLLQWEFEHKALHMVQPAPSLEPQGAQSSSWRSYFRNFSAFSQGFLNSSKPKPLPYETGENLLQTLVLNLFACNPAYEVKIVNHVGQLMLQRYCKYDDPNKPSVLCDAIIAGTVILSLAIHDKKYGRDSKTRNYPLNLDSLFKLCGVDDKYAQLRLLSMNLYRPTKAIKEMILHLGYHALISKTIHYDGIPEGTYSALALAYPKERLLKFGPLNACTEASSSIALSAPANRFEPFEENNTSGSIYYLSSLKRLISEGFSREEVFDDEFDLDDELQSAAAAAISASL